MGDPGVVGRLILKRIFRKWNVGMEWIELVWDGDRWFATGRSGIIALLFL